MLEIPETGELPRTRRPAVVYGGSRSMQVGGVRLLGWREWPEGAAAKPK